MLHSLKKKEWLICIWESQVRKRGLAAGLKRGEENTKLELKEEDPDHNKNALGELSGQALLYEYLKKWQTSSAGLF